MTALFIINLFIVLNYYYFGFYPDGIIKIILTVLGLISLAVGVLLIIKNAKKYEQTESKLDFIKSIPIGIIVCVFMWIMGLL